MKSLNDNFRNSQYKALVLDVDGTTIRYQQEGMPSPKVTAAIQEAQKKIPIILASARPYNALEHIVKHLGLHSYIIANGGARIMDVKKNTIVWEQSIDKNETIKIGELMVKLGIPCFINDDGIDVIFSEKYVPINPLELCSQGLEKEVAQNAVEKLSHIPGISVHTTFAWEKGKMDILVNHVGANKQTGVLEVARLLGINTHDIIAVGDSGNDFPMLMACGLKVAMGNAIPDLKAIADYIAPDVNDDGVADVIEKFIL